MADLPHSGHPPILSEKEGAILEDIITTNPDATNSALADKLKHKNVEVSARTVRKRLNKTELVFGNTMSKPLLSDTHCTKQLAWIMDNKNTD